MIPLSMVFEDNKRGIQQTLNTIAAITFSAQMIPAKFIQPSLYGNDFEPYRKPNDNALVYIRHCVSIVPDGPSC